MSTVFSQLLRRNVDLYTLSAIFLRALSLFQTACNRDTRSSDLVESCQSFSPEHSLCVTHCSRRVSLISRHVQRLTAVTLPFSRLKVRREMMPEVESFHPFVSNHNRVSRLGHPRSYSQYYDEGEWMMYRLLYFTIGLAMAN